MSVNEIAGLVSSVGFPIFACCVMFTQNQNLQKTLSEIALTMQKMADDLDDMKKGEPNDKRD